MKFISWNVNGLRAIVGKGFADAFTQLDADFFCLQETKMQEGQLDLNFEGYNSYWNYADKKGYSGTAIYTKHQPIAVTYGINVDQHDHEADAADSGRTFRHSRSPSQKHSAHPLPPRSQKLPQEYPPCPQQTHPY